MFNNEQNNQNKQIEKIDEEPKTEENIEDEKNILEDMPNSEENNLKQDKGDKLFEGYNGNNCQLRSTNAQSTIKNEEEQKDKEEENNSHIPYLINIVPGQDESQYQDIINNYCKERKPDSQLKEFEQEQEINRESHPNENDEKKDENNGTIDNNNMEIDNESHVITNENINIPNQNQNNEITINLNDINNTHDMVIDNENPNIELINENHNNQINNENHIALINNINNQIENLDLNENIENEIEEENEIEDGNDNIQFPQINNNIQIFPNNDYFGVELNLSQHYDNNDEKFDGNFVLPESNQPPHFSLFQDEPEFHLGNEFQMIMEEDDFDNGINDNNNIGDDFFNSNLNTQDTEEHNNG